MTTLKTLREIEDFILEYDCCVVAFVDDDSPLTKTVRTNLSLIESKIPVGMVDVEAVRAIIHRFTLRVIPAILKFRQGKVDSKLTLPFSKEDVSCLIA